MKVGDMVLVRCENSLLNGKIGTVVLHEESQGIVYGLCVLIQGLVYGFEDNELEVINESR
tara:strand:+ start:806 stop:985 length:180 start_codon:yes stop_codon:yes gene_type:complete